MIKRDVHTLAVVLSALCTLSMGCAHKQDGCRLDTECPNGQICRNTKCESTPESALRAAHDDGRGPGDIQAITNADIQNHTKLVDLGPGAGREGGEVMYPASTTPSKKKSPSTRHKNSKSNPASPSS